MGRMQERGTARVLDLAPTANTDYRFKLEIEGDVIEHVETMPEGKAPLVGDVLPVIVEPRLRIVWDEVPDLADRARASAAALGRDD